MLQSEYVRKLVNKEYIYSSRVVVCSCLQRMVKN